MKGIIGKKLGMTQVYDEQGRLTPVTVIQAGPCKVTAVKTQAYHGYSAVQIGFGSRKAKNVSKAVKGALKAAGCDENPPQIMRELRTDKDSEFALGTELKADIFATGEFVDISGTTKGRGFESVIRRYRFGGGRETHGGAWTRRPGSIGCREMPGNIQKGKKMPGQMGNVTRTVQNLQVVRVQPEENLLFVKGGIPGPNGALVIVRGAKKK